MAVYRFNVTRKTSSGVPADEVVNTFYMDDDEIGLGSWQAFAADLIDFYDLLDEITPVYINQTGHQIDAYRLSDPPPRSPVYSQTWDYAVAPTGPPLPLEVACVLSFQGDPSSGINQQRRRGRIYFGPLRVICIDMQGRIDSSVVGDIRDAGAALLAASIAASYTWVVWSAAAGQAVPVTNGWVDNEPDTQRRRGREATSRLTFT